MLKITLILLGLSFVGLVILFRKRNDISSPQHKSAQPRANRPIYTELRKQALTGSRKAFGLEPCPADAPAWGMLMETGFPEGSASLVAMSDGSASLYFSGGGGVIGGVAHENVRRAASDFVRLAGKHQGSMKATKMFPSPSADRTIFYMLTDSGVLCAEAAENELGEEQHELSPLFYAAQDVITQLREVSEMK